MTLASQIALTATPLSAYFYALGVLHGGRGPRVVSGPVDVGLLGFGVGGVIAFGPLGQAVLARTVGREVGPWHWLAWAALLAAWVVVLAGAASRRLTIYNVTADELVKAVREALAGLGGRFDATLRGFEDAERGSGVALRTSRWLRAGSVEAYGRDPEAIMGELKPALKAALALVKRGPSIVAPAMFAISCLVMLVPVAGYYASTPRAKEALRALLHSLRWW